MRTTETPFVGSNFQTIDALVQSVSQHVTPLANREIDGRARGVVMALANFRQTLNVNKDYIIITVSTRTVPKTYADAFCNGITPVRGAPPVGAMGCTRSVPLNIGNYITSMAHMGNNSIERFLRIKIEWEINSIDFPDTNIIFCSFRY